MFRTYTLRETAELIGMDRHHFPLLCELGMLKGIKTGKERRYSEKEIEEFWERFKGADLSNPENIRFAAAMERLQKNRSDRDLAESSDRT